MSVALQQSHPVPLPEQTHKHGHHHTSKNHSNKRKAQRVQRACSNCRKRKQGCEEERPCKRCVEKGIDCVEVEPKRKRGRAKGQTPHSQRSRSDSRSGDEMVDYDQEEEEENMEDLCDSDEEEPLSDEDSNNSQTVAKPSPIIDNVSSNTGRSPTFRLGDMSSVGNHSTGSIKADSSTPISISHSTSSFAPISRSSSRSSYIAEIRHRSSSVSSDITGAPESPDIDSNDSNIKEDPTEVVMEEADSVSATFPIPNRGMNLALLLPFIGNICSKPTSQEPMMLDEDYSIFNQQLLESSTNDSASTYQSLEAMPADSLTTDLWHSDLPFYTTVSKSGTSPLISTEEGDSRALTYLKECWEEFLFRNGKVPDIEIQCIKESWKETIRCVRSLDWQKLQSSLQEMENLPLSDRFGQQVEPAMLFWTSGGRIHHVNDSFCKLVGYSEEELRLEVSLDISPMVYYHGHRMRAHSIFHPDEAIKILKKQLESVHSADKSCYQMNTRLISKSRLEIPVSCCILNLRDNFGLPLLTVAVFV